MSYQKKYFLTTNDLFGNPWTLEIEKDDAGVVIAEEVQGMASPIIINTPRKKSIFQSVVGSGIDITINCKDNMKFFNEFQFSDPRKYLVKLKKGADIQWLGFLNSEMVTEQFSRFEDYDFTISGNDGFALLDRTMYIQDNGDQYVGNESTYTIIKRCLDKMGLPYAYLNILLSTTFYQYNGVGTSTQLHQMYLNNANFYDESLNPMSCREVLESILDPLEASIVAYGGNLWITDIQTMATVSNKTWRRHSMATGAYVDTVQTFNSHIDVYYKLRAGTGESIETSGGKNMQRIVYSPYPVSKWYENTMSKEEEFGSLSGSQVDQAGSYSYQQMTGNIYWTDWLLSNKCLHYRIIENGGVYYVSRINKYGTTWQTQDDPVMVSKIPILVNCYKHNVPTGMTDHINYRAFVTIKGKVNPGESGFTYVDNYVTVKIGSYYLAGDNVTGGSWTTTPSNYFIRTKNADGSKWGVTAITDYESGFHDLGYDGRGVTIELPITSGDIEVTFRSKVNYSGVFAPPFIWLSDLTIGFTDINGDPLSDDDMEYTGYLDKTYESAAEEITLTCGTGVAMTDRGKFMKPTVDANGVTNYTPIELWSRGINTDKRIEQLLLSSYCTNRRHGTTKINGIKLAEILYEVPIQYIDSVNFPGKIFNIMGITQDVEMGIRTIDIEEISEDLYPIVPL